MQRRKDNLSPRTKAKTSEKRTPKDNLAEYGMQLMNDSKNSENPALTQLRIEMIPKLFDAHIKGNVQVSPRMALFVAVPVLGLLLGTPVYAALHSSRSVVPVTVVCLLGALVFIVFILAICGKMSDGVVARLISGMFNKLVAKLVPANWHDAE
jgi:hypothetical protein